MMTVEKIKNKYFVIGIVGILVVAFVLIFFQNVPTTSQQISLLETSQDVDGDGFIDTTDDACVGIYGTAQGCPIIEGSSPSQTSEEQQVITGSGATVEKGDLMMIQIEGSRHVSTPFFVE